ncbi:MAG TPA: glycosyl hydrolase 53 family protein [Lacibacter sp.]|nr:glycosyl hydrolase 53 family protein [Lacibacter sp.]HMO88845.1 glycosyl hydrolase 53 family protein [Lacibacter sp.]HMP86690.1 glycosyl hydrolase 53 family protein [Lacibacter sp.]
MKSTVHLITLSLLLLISCNKEKNGPAPTDPEAGFIAAVDISSYPEISKANPLFYDVNGNPKDFLQLLKENGVNTIRLRLWVHPVNGHSGLDEVRQFATGLKEKGFKIWLTLHYSDTWADPGSQELPAAWKGLDFPALKDSVYAYTKKIMQEIRPELIQIGNEINSGMLHPHGNITTNPGNFIQLVRAGCSAVRETKADCKIILHVAGFQGANWFFNQVSTVDYDIIGISYYPIWHGKSVPDLAAKLQELSTTYKKKILIAETAYPFTLGWNDWTNNIVGQTDQLILPDYPATPDGQQKFIHQIKKTIRDTKNGIGFCYWGAELIAWKGNQSSTGSPWENQALFDFNNKALPVLNEFKAP